MYIPFLIFGGACLLTAFIFSRVWLRNKRITDKGQMTIATVIGITSGSSRNGGNHSYTGHVSGGNEKYFKPVFEWTVNGQIYKKEHNVGQDPPKYREGQEVAIYYDPANPVEMALQGSEKVTKILMLSFGAGGVLLLLVGVLIWI